MKNLRLAIGAAALAFALPAVSGEALTVAGSPAMSYLLNPHVERIGATSKVDIEVEPVGTGQAMLDLLDGKVAVAGIVMTLPEAIVVAREAAKAERRTLRIPESLTFHQVGTVERGARPIGFVTVGAPPESLRKVLAYLRSDSGRELFARR